MKSDLKSPYLKGGENMSDTMPNGQPWPRISIVTPSFNQGQFIEETIVSVIGQNYSNLEYIVMDGGSTDNTVEIIKKYEKHISHWQSEKDDGQATAINAGFRRATGDILAWVNSDDFYLPGTLHAVAAQLDINKNQLLLGNCFHFFQDSARVEGSDVVTHHANSNLLLNDYVIQPSSFWTKQTWQQTGELNEHLHFAFDWEWFIRAQQSSTEFVTCQKYLSAYRFHDSHKTGTGGEKRSREIGEIYKTYSGEKYQRLFQRLRHSQKKVGRCRRLIQLSKLSKIENLLMKVMVPELYWRYASNEINDVSSLARSCSS